LDPNDSTAYNNIGVLLSKIKKHDIAIQNYDKAIELNPNYLKCYINRGVSLRVLKRNNESIQSYDKSIELKPNVEAYFHKAYLFYEVNLNIRCTIWVNGPISKKLIDTKYL